MNNSDSDDFEPRVRVSKLSRKKKSKNTENGTGKAHTSTQVADSLDGSEAASSRSGRAGRKTADEVKFQKELEEAMRLSSEEASMSSAEIAPCKSETLKEDGDSSFDHAAPNKYGAIVEEAIRETEILAKVPEPEKKRKVEEAWVTEQSPRRSRPKGKKLVIESSDDEDDFVGDESSDEEEFEIKPTKKSKVNKKDTKPKEVVKRVSPRKAANKKSPEPNVPITEPLKSPLREHNRLAALPKCQNMFQNKSPVKLKVTPRKEAPPPVPKPVIPTKISPQTVASPATPGLSSSLANILGKLSSRPASKQPPPASPVPSKALVMARTPVTPGQRRLPSWTPPAKAGSAGGSSVLASPSIGLRVGLSRKHRGKPLHSSVKL